MPVTRLQALTVINHNELTISTLPPDTRHTAIGRSIDALALIAATIQAGMQYA